MLGDHKVGNYPIANGASHFNTFWRAAYHVIRFMPDRHHCIIAQANRYNRRLMHDNSATFDMHQNIHGAQVDPDMLFKHKYGLLPLIVDNPHVQRGLPTINCRIEFHYTVLSSLLQIANHEIIFNGQKQLILQVEKTGFLREGTRFITSVYGYCG